MIVPTPAGPSLQWRRERPAGPLTFFRGQGMFEDTDDSEVVSDRDLVRASQYLKAMGLDHPDDLPDHPQNPGEEWGAKPWGHDATALVVALKKAEAELQRLGVRLPVELDDKIETALHLLQAHEHKAIQEHLKSRPGHEWSSSVQPLDDDQQDVVRSVLEHHLPGSSKTVQFSLPDDSLTSQGEKYVRQLAARNGVDLPPGPIKLAAPLAKMAARASIRRSTTVQFSQPSQDVQREHDKAQAAAVLARINSTSNNARPSVADRLAAKEIVERLGLNKRR